MKRILKWSTLVLVVGLLVGQFVRPEKTNPPVDPTRTLEARAQVPPEVQSILQRSCKDCHSYLTRWPWYSHVAPTSWIVASDVEEGREQWNMSDWARNDARKADQILEEICEEIEAGKMPLRSYTLAHRGTSLSDAEVKLLCDWTRAERQRLSAQPVPQQGHSR
ncbi:MAG: heme-binding domain-containing protein [Acidobacteriota bacterium]